MSAHTPATAAVAQSSLRKKWFQRAVGHWDFAIALGLLALLGLYFGLRRTPVPISRLDDFDFSFTVELIAKTQQGLWLGRDEIFTYGPLCQWIYGHLATVRGQSLGDIYLSLWMFELGSVVLLFYAACVLFLAHQPPWKRAFCLLLLVIFWTPITELPLGDIKRLLPLVALGIFTRVLQPFPRSGAAIVTRAALAAVVISMSFLFSGDDGVYALAAFAIVLAGALVRPTRAERVSLLRYALCSAAWFALCILAINALMGGIFDFHFWRGNYEVIRTYRWTENFAMPDFVFRRLLLAIAIALAIFATEWWRQRHARSQTDPGQRMVLWSCAAFAVIGLQPAMVRGDWVNVSLALTPVIALTLFVLMGAAQTSALGWRPLVPTLLALALTAALSGPNHLFMPRNLSAGFRSLRANAVCGPGTTNLEGFCLSDENFRAANQTAEKLAAISSLADSVAVFPYQNLYAFLAHRRVAAAVLQNYLEAGDWLTAQQLDSYEQSKPAHALFFADGVASGRLNQVPNFTREPAVWFYLQRWYSAVDAPAPGVAILTRDSQRAARWRITTAPLALAPHNYEVKDNTEIEIAKIPPVPMDFLRVRLKLNYPIEWKLQKPGTITFIVRYADGSAKNLGAVVEPGKTTEVWIYSWREEQLLRYFLPSEAEWRNAAERPAVSTLSVKFTRSDAFSVLPENMEVYGVDAVGVAEQ